ncbi:MAG: YafY family transcriptional regulator, partial [Methylococcaceae bacterium]|nr:YafY family transcriptional regulator [Methylococcaceae bacterium]
RIFALDRLLKQRRNPVSLPSIEQTLECSPATAKRAIQALRDYLNAPVEYDRAQRGYYYKPEADGEIRFELPGLWLNDSELYALLASYQLLGGFQPGLLTEHIAPLRARIEKLLDSAAPQSRFDAGRRIRMLQSAARPANLENFRTIATAVIARKRLKILYHGRAQDRTTERSVSPQRLVYYRDNWYLDAWCHLRSALRTFSLDRIHPLPYSDIPAEEIPEDTLDGFQAESYGIFSGSPGHRALLRFTPKSARWVADESWHPQQQAKILEDGGFELRIPYSNPTELVMDILKYGPDVEVLEPESLRKAVSDRLKEALKRYE